MKKREMLGAVPRMRYAVRVRHTQTGSVLTANSYYIRLNEDALAIVNLIDGGRCIEDIANEICTNKKLSGSDRSIVAISSKYNFENMENRLISRGRFRRSCT